MSLVFDPTADYMPLKEFAGRIDCSYDRVLRWAVNGSSHPTVANCRVRLATIHLPNGRATTMEAYQQFIAELNDPGYIGGSDEDS